MHTYEFEISINGNRTKLVINADNAIAARKIVEAQYSNCKLIIWSQKDIK